MRGFCEKRRVDRGFLLVNLWWNDGESWCVDGCILGAENFPLFRDLFLGRQPGGVRWSMQVRQIPEVLHSPSEA